MPDGWEATTVGELLARDGGSVKTGPFGTVLKADEYSTEGVPLISVGEVGYGSLRVHESTPRAPKAVVDRLPEYVLNAGDIVFGRKGAVDRSAMVKPAEAGWFLGSDGIRLRLPGSCDSRFVAYQFQSAELRAWFLQHATGTTMASLNQATIERAPLILPPLAQQRAISEVLGGFDEKIELNRRISETLESMARALFKSWFVDFEPVRAKSNGQATGLAREVADLFPDSLSGSEIGEIPRGWEPVQIDTLAEVVGGTTPSTSIPAYWDGGTHHWATPKDLAALSFPVLLETERQITDEGLAAIGSGLLPPGTVLLSSRAPIGYLAVTELPVAINQGFIAMVPRAGVSNLFLLHWARAAQAEILSRANGSTFLEISKSSFRPILVAAPQRDLMTEFEKVVRPLYSRLLACLRESALLARIRDALLPRLISGEVRVR